MPIPNFKVQGLESESENIDSNLLLAVLALLMIQFSVRGLKTESFNMPNKI